MDKMTRDLIDSVAFAVSGTLPTTPKARETAKLVIEIVRNSIASAPPSTSVEDGPIDANDNAEYIEHCADRLERCGLPVTGGVLRAIAHEHRALAQQPAAERVDVRKLVALAEQWERYADGCRPYGFIKEAELLEHCAQCIRQALGISASESSLILPGRDPLVEKLLSIAIKDKEKERLTARAEQSAAVDEAMKNLRDAILRNDGLTRKNTLAAFWAVEDALAAQQRGEVT